MVLVVAVLAGLLAVGPAASWNEGAGKKPSTTANSLYRSYKASDPQLLKLKKKIGASYELVLAKINRMDRRHLRRSSALIAPTRPLDILDLSPFPRIIERAEGWPKIVFVSLRVQAFGAYENGRLVRWGPISTGVKDRPTPPGLYSTNGKSRRKVSTLDRTWIMPWYVNLHTSMGVAFHQYSMPGKPESHGCIRLLREDAQWMYQWTDDWVPSENHITAAVYGTPVIVFGEYGYREQPPWKLLPKNPSATDVSPAEIHALLEKYGAVIDQRAQARQSRTEGTTEPRTERFSAE